MMCILKCLHAKLLFRRCFDIESKLDRYLDVFSVVLSNTVFIRLEHSHKSIVNLQVNSLSIVVIKKRLRTILLYLCLHWLCPYDLCFVLRGRNLDMDTMSEAADLPISPLKLSMRPTYQHCSCLILH